MLTREAPLSAQPVSSSPSAALCGAVTPLGGKPASAETSHGTLSYLWTPLGPGYM